LEFSFDKQQDSDTANIANERLRKAIERNRQRQREREEKEDKEQKAQPAREHYQAPLGEQPSERPKAPPRPPPIFDQQTAKPENKPEEVEPIIERPTRRTVARPHDTEFVAVKRPAVKKPAAALNYHTTSTRKKSKPLDPAIVSFLTKAAWIFAGILVLRLVFAKGGVTDFYAQHKLLDQRHSELVAIKNENMQLVREIERMHNDAGYQKKLVRDNLGFIASDEYLVLFPKE
jgi:cell division protein FtsB